MNLLEIARLCAASQMLNAELAATEPAGFAIDSRAVKPGDLFVALPGERVDGHKFVEEVFEKGACAAMVVHHRLPFATNLGELAGKLLFVENTACALQQMAARVLAKWHRPVIGMTGSAGKTTMKDLTAHVMAAAGNVLKSLGNLNTSYGLPLTVSRMICAGVKPADFDFAVLEMGMSSFGEIARLTDIAPPTIGIVGNVGTAHIEFFGSQERIARAKSEMVEGIKPGGTAVLNADDPRVTAMQRLRDDVGVVSFGIEAVADVTATGIVVANDLSHTSFVLKTPDGEAAVALPLVGRHNVYNALAAAAAAHSFGLSANLIAERLSVATPSKMRGELIRFENGVTVIDDSYNSNPQALLEAVRAMTEAKDFKRRLVVAGEMLELGEQGIELHRHCGRQMAALGIGKIDWLVGVRGLAKDLVEGARNAGLSQAVFCESPEEAAERLIAETHPGDLVLVKGSRGVRTEKVIEKLRAAFGSVTTN
ncbi:MAG TPA: UDP-N-acetylmuramoyl-tripeptide--D-alanyl-D-alanine ligase [Blastocatellia bacterium]|nr:UDP-N-acetylmuramoyl-tripeptide--D-alanyl-D-alanine ligase [Blastocatellia bacterium]HMX25842.1 UDP-N-acetylmuramoyl-tripeptide--D-alanyl-D-alanine ligase [Blastocatellia bacterium]HMZ20501.1 UDP-N-acetylmuramoyl-tripeptide--D-alanyl-D-alanine ligase [Blastocatellia bacterium]HNG31406.1 UDP-N-acetylmuramoyl-tripeptide--D-alanyl-D-alanine ligase [Blastocatellia bacterium]